MKTKPNELTEKEVEAIRMFELLMKLMHPKAKHHSFFDDEVELEQKETKAKGLDFDENGEVIEDFSYLETFES